MWWQGVWTLLPLILPLLLPLFLPGVGRVLIQGALSGTARGGKLVILGPSLEGKPWGVRLHTGGRGALQQAQCGIFTDTLWQWHRLYHGHLVRREWVGGTGQVLLLCSRQEGRRGEHCEGGKQWHS